MEYMRMREKQAMEQSDNKELQDMVNHPPHYNKYGVECIEAIKSATGEGFEYYLQGNILKYLWRYRYKNGVEDLNKAQWYLTKLIDTLENDKSKNDVDY